MAPGRAGVAKKEGEEEDAILQHSTTGGDGAAFDLSEAIAVGGTRSLGTEMPTKAQREGEEEDSMLMATFDPTEA